VNTMLQFDSLRSHKNRHENATQYVARLLVKQLCVLSYLK